jgi:vacuole morphology and inheritance protein 14
MKPSFSFTHFPSIGILIKEVDLEFAPLMVQNLNLILLTAPELEKLRRELMAMASPESFSLFVELYKSWCHSPVATLALCLLAQVYDHACQLLDKFAWLEVTVELLVEVRPQKYSSVFCPLSLEYIR